MTLETSASYEVHIRLSLMDSFMTWISAENEIIKSKGKTRIQVIVGKPWRCIFDSVYSLPAITCKLVYNPPPDPVFTADRDPMFIDIVSRCEPFIVDITKNVSKYTDRQVELRCVIAATKRFLELEPWVKGGGKTPSSSMRIRNFFFGGGLHPDRAFDAVAYTAANGDYIDSVINNAKSLTGNDEFTQQIKETANSGVCSLERVKFGTIMTNMYQHVVNGGIGNIVSTKDSPFGKIGDKINVEVTLKNSLLIQNVFAGRISYSEMYYFETDTKDQLEWKSSTNGTLSVTNGTKLMIQGKIKSYFKNTDGVMVTALTHVKQIVLTKP